MCVNAIVDIVDSGFPEVAALINDDPGFVKAPKISPSDNDHFLMIVVAGNLHFVPEYFTSPQDKRISNLIVEKLAKVLEIDEQTCAKIVNQYSEFLEEVNESSLNILHGIARAIFYKYELNDYQQDHYRKMNAPSPVFLIKVGDVMNYFMWSWETLLSKYKITT